VIHKYRNKALASRSIVVNGDLDSEYREYGDNQSTNGEAGDKMETV